MYRLWVIQMPMLNYQGPNQYQHNLKQVTRSGYQMKYIHNQVSLQRSVKYTSVQMPNSTDGCGYGGILCAVAKLFSSKICDIRHLCTLNYFKSNTSVI